MKLFKSKLRVLALAAGSLAISMAGANAANANYAAGDLVLYFQQEGNAKTVYVDLGAATIYRGSATGPGVISLDIIDINAQLNSAFGSWTTATNLYMGVAGVYSNSTAQTMVNLDPGRTLYLGQSRDSVGTVGQLNSTGYSGINNTDMTGAATSIQTMIAPVKNGATATVVVAASAGSTTSNIAAQNPFLAPAVQDTAFGVFSGGVQQVSTGGLFAASFGPVSNVQMALDVYRIEARNDVVGQIGFGSANTVGTGTYEGTLTLSNTGKVSFVPEPSTYGLMGLSAVVIGFVAVRRRQKMLSSKI